MSLYLKCLLLCIKFKFKNVFYILCVIISLINAIECNSDAKRLYDDLISGYNRLVLPVNNSTQVVPVKMKLKLSQLIDVNIKDQIMVTNMWVEQYWHDYKLTWDPSEYGSVDKLHVPSEEIWRPDIALYNNAAGDFELSIATKAVLSSKGFIHWQPPAIYKSSCQINVEYFPFDIQTCLMKFGTWSFDGSKVDLRHMDEIQGNPLVEYGIDLSEFYLSVEWDIIEVPAKRNIIRYRCCEATYIDITFNISMRRKSLFYTVNLIIPCCGISFLTVLVFYLPSDSKEKVSLSVSVLVAHTIFFVLLAETIPPTSLVLPLLGKYLVITMILVTLSICFTILVLNIHFRSSSTHRMAPWVNKLFIQILPKFLFMNKPHYHSLLIQPARRSLDKWKCIVRGLDSFDLPDHDNLFEPYSYFIYDNLNRQQALNEAYCESIFENREIFDRKQDNNSSAIYDKIRQDELSREMESTSKKRLMLNAYDNDDEEEQEDKKQHEKYCMQSNENTSFVICECKIHGPKVHRKLINNQLKDDIASSLSTEAISFVKPSPSSFQYLDRTDSLKSSSTSSKKHICPDILKALDNIHFLSNHQKKTLKYDQVKENWKFVATVLDRLFLCIFTVLVLVGACGIFLSAPTLYDQRKPIDVQYSKVYHRKTIGRY